MRGFAGWIATAVAYCEAHRLDARYTKLVYIFMADYAFTSPMSVNRPLLDLGVGSRGLAARCRHHIQSQQVGDRELGMMGLSKDRVWNAYWQHAAGGMLILLQHGPQVLGRGAAGMAACACAVHGMRVRGVSQAGPGSCLKVQTAATMLVGALQSGVASSSYARMAPCYSPAAGTCWAQTHHPQLRRTTLVSYRCCRTPASSNCSLFHEAHITCPTTFDALTQVRSGLQRRSWRLCCWVQAVCGHTAGRTLLATVSAAHLQLLEQDTQARARRLGLPTRGQGRDASHGGGHVVESWVLVNRLQCPHHTPRSACAASCEACC